MPQPPFLSDQIQIEPGLAGSRLIRAHASGTLQFQDPEVTATLLELVGLRRVDGLYLVGRGGSGAPYTSIQEALDAIPSSSSASAPATIWVLSGTYQENLKIQKDGVRIYGFGARVVNDGASDTITISASTTTTPLSLQVWGLEIENTSAGFACVRALGADSFASGTATIGAAPLVLGTTFTVGGLPLVGVVGARTAGADNFSVSGSTLAAVAAEVAAALNDPENSFSELVLAEPSGAVVDLTAQEAGSAGNAITLLSSSVNLTVSGANLTGGSAENSLVLTQGALFRDCLFVAGAGAYQMGADTVNRIEIHGGSFRGSSSGTSAQFENCAEVQIRGVEFARNLDFSYDSSLDRPIVTSSSYRVAGIGTLGDVGLMLEGAGEFEMLDCPMVQSLVIGGDRTALLQGVHSDLLALDGTTEVSSWESSFGSVITPGGTPTLALDRFEGDASFAAASSVPVVFDIPQPDADYFVYAEVSSSFEVVAATARTAAGFTLQASGVLNEVIGFTLRRG